MASERSQTFDPAALSSTLKERSMQSAAEVEINGCKKLSCVKSSKFRGVEFQTRDHCYYCRIADPNNCRGRYRYIYVGSFDKVNLDEYFYLLYIITGVGPSDESYYGNLCLWHCFLSSAII